MKGLTERQQRVYDVVKEHLELTGMPPTRAEIAKTLGFKSANAAEEHLKALAKKGAIEMIPGSSRGLRLLLDEDDTPHESGIPLVGKVAAGVPILAMEQIEQYYQLDPTLFSPSADFLLRVEGMSMKNIGIQEGDLLVVHKTQEVQQGQVVVARVGDEVTVKRFKRQGNVVYLLPENELFSPIKVDLTQTELTIEGRAVGVIRTQTW